MTTSNFNLRGLSEEMLSKLKLEAKRLHTSVNALIIKILGSELGIHQERVRPVYHDLDALAGSWSAAEVETFQAQQRDFENIDRELWR